MEEIAHFERSMQAGDLQGFCDHMRSVCEDKEEQQLWSFMKVKLMDMNDEIVYV